jgi:hypothetical protein
MFYYTRLRKTYASLKIPEQPSGKTAAPRHSGTSLCPSSNIPSSGVSVNTGLYQHGLGRRKKPLWREGHLFVRVQDFREEK